MQDLEEKWLFNSFDKLGYVETSYDLEKNILNIINKRRLHKARMVFGGSLAALVFGLTLSAASFIHSITNILRSDVGLIIETVSQNISSIMPQSQEVMLSILENLPTTNLISAAVWFLVLSCILRAWYLLVKKHLTYSKSGLMFGKL